MANGSDGSLVIDTELDNEGFEKGSDKLMSSVDNLAKQVNTLGLEMKNAFAGVTSILQSLANASNNAASGANSSTQQATQAANAAQQAAQAQTQAAQQNAQAQTQAAQQTSRATAQTTTATQTATAATRAYDKELARLQKQISSAKSKLAGYYQELANIEQSTSDMMRDVSDGPAAESQINNILEIEKIQIDAVNEKWKAKLDILKQLEAQYANVAAARDGSNKSVATVPTNNTTGSSAASTGITESGAAAEAANPKVNFFTQILSRLGPAMQRVGSAALSVGRSIGRITFGVVATGAKKAVSALKSFITRAKRTTTQANALTKALTGLRRMLVMRIKHLFITALFKNVGEGLKQLARFDSKFNEQMSGMKNSITQLSGNIAATVANLLSALEPVITTVIDLMNKAVIAVNQFFAMLSGKSSYAAAKKGTEDYAKAAADAAGAQKKLNAELYGFDELNRQSGQGDGGGGGAGDSAIQYEETPVDLPTGTQAWISQLKAAWSGGQWRDFGKIAAEGLNASFEALDDWINSVLRPMGANWASRIAEILNGLTEGVDWPVLGKTIADGLNSVADIYNTFMYSYDWSNLGMKLGEALNSLAANVEWGAIGASFAAKWQALVNLVHGFVHEVKWDELGKGIGEAVYAWFMSIDWVKLANSVVVGFNGLVTLLRNAIVYIDWGTVGTALANSITTLVTGIDWANIGELLSDAILGLLHLCLNLISDIDWYAVGDSLMQGIIDMIVNIDWLKILTVLGSLAVNLVAGALNLVLGALGGAAKKLADAFMALGMDGIAGFFQGLSDGLANIGTWIKTHIVDPVVNWIKKLFGIHSPSTVMAEIGGYLIQGLWQTY